MVNYLCWDLNGELLASVSEESVKVWSLATGDCIHELSSTGNQFHSCVFHPSYPALLVIGGMRVNICSFLQIIPVNVIQKVYPLTNLVVYNFTNSCFVNPCLQSLELWNMVENKSMTIPAHENIVAALAQSPVSGMVASASHDSSVKLWK